MEYKEDFEERSDVFRYSTQGINFYFVPNDKGKYEFCTKEETKEDLLISLWMTRVKDKDVSIDSIPFVIRDALIKAAKIDISKKDLIGLRKKVSKFANSQGIDFKEKPISNIIRPPLSKNIKVLGLMVEKYVEDVEIDFESCTKKDSERYHLIVQDVKNKNKYVITLLTKDGLCGSGWCSATYGEINIKKLDKGMPFTHIPKKTTFIDGFTINPDTLEWSQEFIPMGSIKYDVSDIDREMESTDINNIFAVSVVGGDPYYPSGYCRINFDNFEKTYRAMDKRPVWIIEGPSGIGKSTLASHIEGLSVFETDSVDKLPEVIYDDVVVLGNRSGFTVEDVKDRLFGEHEVIEVSFRKDSKENERNKNNDDKSDEKKFLTFDDFELDEGYYKNNSWFKSRFTAKLSNGLVFSVLEFREELRPEYGTYELILLHSKESGGLDYCSITGSDDISRYNTKEELNEVIIGIQKMIMDDKMNKTKKSIYNQIKIDKSR